MANIQEYKCPCCGGAIAFDSTIQKMKCPYCDTEFEMEALQGYDEVLKQDQEAGGLRTYQCKSCGGEIVGDESMAASSCPYCGNPIVLMGQFAGALRPDYVIPFKLDKKAAKAGLMKHLNGKRLLPKIFKDQNHIDEIKGVYVPFWLFDASADAMISYQATKQRTWSDSSYDYTETQYFMLDGSTKMEDELMESIEPFDFDEAVPFQTAYLAGYMADKYDVSAEESIERANTRIKKSTEDHFRSTVKGYDDVSVGQSSVQLHGGSIKYVLYPVWLLNTTWNGKQYRFAMNGQNGKFVGDLPVDQGAARRWMILTTAAVAAGAYGISWLLWLAGIL